MDVNSAKGSMATSLAQFARFSYRWGLHPGDRERERERGRERQFSETNYLDSKDALMDTQKHTKSDTP